MNSTITLNVISGTIDPNYIKEVKKEYPVSKDSQIWFVIAVDGCNNPSSTHSVPISENFTLNHQLTINFTRDSLDGCYMYTSLCIEDKSKNMEAISRSKTCITKIPLNGGLFSLPLMNRGKRVATISLTCVLQAFVNYQQSVLLNDHQNPYMNLKE